MPDRALSHCPDTTVEPLRLSPTSVWNKIPTLPSFSWRKSTTGDNASNVSCEPQESLPQLSGTRSASPPQRGPRPVFPGLPRAGTFSRQESERRENLHPRELCDREKRRLSSTRRRAFSALGFKPPRTLTPQRSDPDMKASSSLSPQNHVAGGDADLAGSGALFSPPDTNSRNMPDPFTDSQPKNEDENDVEPGLSDRDSTSDGLNSPGFREELEKRWILNLSMAFRDKSDREKFFVTYAEQPNRWRRVTISCDYRDAPEDSLEADLKTLRYQRDKSAHIYEAIRDSLKSVQFYNTVTNLKLETSDERLHVHVTEDINEIIPYPPLSAVGHLDLSESEYVPESALHFDSHLSGFVYKVSVNNSPYIKKEIPGPDMVDEFLYEVNTLWHLRNSDNIISFHGVVVDDSRTVIKGLLIAFADNGALVDLIYEAKTSGLSWARRTKWANQIVSGLSEIHENGFVQGDFTLSNIVIDGKDNAKIIDINRRGCPVGWEPPEFQGLIESSQRISMFIGVKSDLYQLGMVLWALCVMDDEPERSDGDLSLDGVELPGSAEFLRAWTHSCLSEDPTRRKSAKELLQMVPAASSDYVEVPVIANASPAYTGHRPEKEYIDPALAMALDDVEDIKRRSAEQRGWDDFSYGDTTQVDPNPESRSRIENADFALAKLEGLSPAEVAMSSPGQHHENAHPVHHDASSTLAPDHDEQFRDVAEVETLHVQRLRSNSHISDVDEEVDEPESFAEPESDLPLRQPGSGLLHHDSLSQRRSALARGHASPPLHQDSGLGGLDSPTVFDHGNGLEGVHPSAKEHFSHPVHQDSGLAGLEDMLPSSARSGSDGASLHMYAGGRFGPPSHQDSGFDEAQFSALANKMPRRETGPQNASPMTETKRNATGDFVGIGAHTDEGSSHGAQS